MRSERRSRSIGTTKDTKGRRVAVVDRLAPFVFFVSFVVQNDSACGAL
jgi:hypothetical protein